MVAIYKYHMLSAASALCRSPVDVGRHRGRRSLVKYRGRRSDQPLIKRDTPTTKRAHRTWTRNFVDLVRKTGRVCYICKLTVARMVKYSGNGVTGPQKCTKIRRTVRKSVQTEISCNPLYLHYDVFITLKRQYQGGCGPDNQARIA